MELGNVLVVGGCGFLGWHIVDHLLNFPSESDPSVALPKLEGDERFNFPSLASRFPNYKANVSVVDLRTSNNRLPGATYYDGDITSVESMMDVFRAVKPEVVIHTASPSPIHADKEMLRKVNVDGTRTLVQVAGGEHGDWGGKCKAFVYTSSASVIHDTESDLINVTEEWPLIRGPRQKEYYSETKVGLRSIRAIMHSLVQLKLTTLPSLGRCRRIGPELQSPVPDRNAHHRYPTSRYYWRKRHDSHLQDHRASFHRLTAHTEDAAR